MDAVTFRLSHKILVILSLDDAGLVSQTFPTFKRVKAVTPTVDLYEASYSDALVILDDLVERSKDQLGGFEHTATERRALKRAAMHLATVLMEAKRAQDQAAGQRAQDTVDAKLGRTRPYTFRPYDVLQVQRNGVWLDYSTLRTEGEGRLAVSAVNLGSLNGEQLPFRITRNSPRYGTVVHTKPDTF